MFLRDGKKIQHTLNVMILEITMNLTLELDEVAGIQVKYKILQLKIPKKLLFSINPPISAHAFIFSTFGSSTSRSFRI